MDKKLSFLVLIFFLVLGAFATVLFQKETRLTRAASQVPDAIQSFIIVSTKDNECTVNAVVRDQEQKGVPNKEVCFTATVGTPSAPCALTNESGIAEIVVTSTTPGSGQISAQVTDHFQIPTQVSCLFPQ
ncbi:Ig-like domain-containing protein [Candidatus Woesebacteria bacterium]|nr:Ig-like domain-containing protein [Candidatus Woesebacteria bacterium]